MAHPPFLYIDGLPYLNPVSGSMTPQPDPVTETVFMATLLAEQCKGMTEAEIAAMLISLNPYTK